MWRFLGFEQHEDEAPEMMHELFHVDYLCRQTRSRDRIFLLGDRVTPHAAQ